MKYTDIVVSSVLVGLLIYGVTGGFRKLGCTRAANIIVAAETCSQLENCSLGYDEVYEYSWALAFKGGSCDVE